MNDQVVVSVPFAARIYDDNCVSGRGWQKTMYTRLILKTVHYVGGAARPGSVVYEGILSLCHNANAM